MKNIESISYQYTRDFRNPINYIVNTDTVTTTLSYEDAIKIAESVIDSLGGSYDFLEELEENFKNDGIKIESIV